MAQLFLFISLSLSLTFFARDLKVLSKESKISLKSSPKKVSLASPRPVRLSTANVSAAVFSESNPVHPALFGPLRHLVATASEQVPGQHPRIVVGPSQWDEVLSMYADDKNFERSGTWSHFFRSVTLKHATNSFVTNLATSLVNLTDRYQPQPYRDTEYYQSYRDSLAPLASLITMGNAGNSDALPLCALWASVALKRDRMGATPFIPIDTYKTCIRAAVTWSKIILAHRAFYCNPECPTQYNQTTLQHLWDPGRKFSLDYNWMLGGTGIAFTYDLLYDYIDEVDKVSMRSILALYSLNRFAWGASQTSTRRSPNAAIHPHRIFSNWAGYNSNLYLANLAIEGENGFDDYATSVLNQHNKTSGFNQELHTRYSALLEQFLMHSFYPDGSTFEDGYSYFLALREGSLGLLASHRRGSNVLGSARFRNIIHNAAQMHEPWHCGSLIGHSSGGGNLYNSYVGLFRYAYPHGELPGMIWRQRFGDYRNNRPCRIFWTQSVLQLMFLGGEHSSEAESPGTLDASLQKHFRLSYFTPRRGLLIARSSLSENASYIHFDARPDAFFLGHDNADRGVFTFSALRQTWFDDLHWASNLDSRKHSLLHIDGLAQDLRAPSVRMFKVLEEGNIVLAAADLSYAYNVQWARGHNYNIPPTRKVTVYNDTTGNSTEVQTTFGEPEMLDPWFLGWPSDDSAADLGFRDNMGLHGEENIGFMGIWQWKRNYREVPLSHMVRSAVLVRSHGNTEGYGIIVDSVSTEAGEHVFDSYLILNPKVRVIEQASSCAGSVCRIVLTAGEAAILDVHVVALGIRLTYRVESFGESSRRLIVSSRRELGEEFWVVMHGHSGDFTGFSVVRNANSTMTITHDDEQDTFALDETDHSVKQVVQSAENRIESATPTAPQPLDEDLVTVVQEKEMVKNRTLFYDLSAPAPLQAVFGFNSKSSEETRLQDKFVTCSRRTTVMTNLGVYDCGDNGSEHLRYTRRECTPVTRSTVARSCRSYRTVFKSKLIGGKYYVLVVAMTTEPAAREPRLVLRHSTAAY